MNMTHEIYLAEMFPLPQIVIRGPIRTAGNSSAV
jgi:hypothetical protein